MGRGGIKPNGWEAAADAEEVVLGERGGWRRWWAHQTAGATAAFVASHLAAGRRGRRRVNWEFGRRS